MLAEFAIIIPDQVFWGVSIRSRFSQLLCHPEVCRRARYIHMDHLARLEFNEEEGKKRTEEEIGYLQEITGPYFCRMIAQKGFPGLSTGLFWVNLLHILLNSPFADANIQLEKLTPNALGAPEPIVCCHFLNQADRLR